MIEEGTTVLPGDKVAVSEELKAGKGTYEENGEIIAAVVGKFRVNREEMSAEVEPLSSTPLLLHIGDTAIGEVKQVTEAMVILKIIHIAGKHRQVAGERDAAIHISNVSDEFVESLKGKYRIGDILRGKIIRVEPAIQMSTRGKEFGVIKAYCTICRSPLVKKGELLECPSCGRVEERKIADDYGAGDLDRVI